jgi:hypothetical protein
MMYDDEVIILTTIAVKNYSDNDTGGGATVNNDAHDEGCL